MTMRKIVLHLRASVVKQPSNEKKLVVLSRGLYYPSIYIYTGKKLHGPLKQDAWKKKILLGFGLFSGGSC